MTPQQAYDQQVGNADNEIYPFLPFLRRKGRGNILEIGTCQGWSTAAFLLGVECNGGHVYSVDIDPNCAGLYAGHPHWTFIHSDSRTVSKVRAAGPVTQLDVLLIDGYHEHPIVDSDIANYAPRVRDGGVILMHDINMGDVRDAYHDFIRATHFEHFELQEKWGLGVIYK